MSDSDGSWNLVGSLATSASRSSLGNAKPISVSSRENATNTICPTRNLIRSRTTTSYARGSGAMTARPSSTVDISGHPDPEDPVPGQHHRVPGLAHRREPGAAGGLDQ